MPKCPYCDAGLSSGEAAANACVACGREFAEIMRADTIVTSSEGLAPDPAAEPDESPSDRGTIDESPIRQTTDEPFEIPLESSKPPLPGTVSDRAVAGTVDSGSPAVPPNSERIRTSDNPHGHPIADSTESTPPIKTTTIVDSPTVQTVEFGDGDVPMAEAPSDPASNDPVSNDQAEGEPHLGSGTIDIRMAARTIEIGGAKADGSRKKPTTVFGRARAETLDSPELPGDVVERLNQTWNRTAQQTGATINTSLKVDEGQAEEDSRTSLVIQSRSFGDADAVDVALVDYNLLELLGEGGMGMVYAARQASIDRTVAIKMLKPATANDKVQRNKFLAEAAVTGDLEHPNIVPIYDLGRNDQGSLFYAMKRVQGTPWEDVQAKKTLPENIEILMKVCDALAFSHSRGVIHRDLKPENVMLGGFGEVLVMDWGLAVPTDRRLIAGVQPQISMGGTPAYMAPEMARGPFERIGPACDIYLLGAMLYEIVTGLPPHTGADVMKCLFAAARNQIRPTAKKGELIEIAMRAMETRPEDRFATVQEFQDAIRRYQAHSESIVLAARAAEDLARAEQSQDYQDFARAMFGFQESAAMWDGNERAKAGLEEARFAYARTAHKKGDYDLGASLLDLSITRHANLHDQIVADQQERAARQQRLQSYKRIGAVLVATFLLVVTGAAIWIYLEKQEADRQRQIAVKNSGIAKVAEGEAKKQRDLAQYEAYVARIGAAAAKIDENAYESARELLTECIPQNGEPDYRNWEWGRLWYLCHQSSQVLELQAKPECVAYAPDGQRFATGDDQGRIIIWNADGQRVDTFDAGAAVHAIDFSPDPAGSFIAVGTDGNLDNLKIFNTGDGSLHRALTDDGHAKAVLSVEYSRDGVRLLSGSRDETAKLWDVETGRPLQTLQGHRGAVWKAALCPHFGKNGRVGQERRLVTVSQDGTAVVWVDETGEWTDSSKILRSPSFRGHSGPIYCASFSPDGRVIATGGHDKRVLLWKVRDLDEFDFGTATAEFIAELDRNRLLTNSEVSAPKFRQLSGHRAAVRSLKFSESGNMLVSAGQDNTVRIWNFESGSLLKTLRGHDEWVRSCDVSPDGDWVLSASHDREVRKWNVKGYEEVRVLQTRLLDGHEDSILDARFAHGDHSKIVTASRDRTVKTWQFATGQEVATFREGHQFLASNVVVFNDGQRLITSAVDNTARIWDAATGTQKILLEGTGRSAAVAVSDDGQWVLTGGTQANASAGDKSAGQQQRWRAHLWNAETGDIARTFTVHRSPVSAVAFSPSGKYLFTGDALGVGYLWDREQERPLKKLSWHAARIIAASFVSDERLLTAASEASVAEWNLATDEKPSSSHLLKHPVDVTTMALSPRAGHVLTGTRDGSVRLWRLGPKPSEVLLRKPRQRKTAEDVEKETISRVGFSADGRFGLSAHVVYHQDRSGNILGIENQVRIWDLRSGKEIQFARTRESLGSFLEIPRGTALWSAAFSADSRSVITAGGDLARMWDVNTELTQRQRRRMSFSPHGVVASADFSTQGTQIVSGSWDGSARIWDVDTNRHVLKLVGRHSRAVNCATFSPDDSSPNGDSGFVVTTSDDGLAVLWDATTGKPLQTLSGHSDAVLWATFSPDGNQILTTCQDGTARIWDRQGNTLRVLKGHAGPVTRAAFDASGKRVVTGSEDNTAKVWAAATGDHLLDLVGHTASVTSVAFSPDGKRVITGSEDYTAKVWDANPPNADSSKEILTLKGHDLEVTSVNFSDDENGRYVLTSSHDGSAIIWLTEPWDQDETKTAADPKELAHGDKAPVPKRPGF